MDGSKKSCGRSTFERNEKESTSTLKIRWKRLISKGETCPSISLFVNSQFYFHHAGLLVDMPTHYLLGDYELSSYVRPIPQSI